METVLPVLEEVTPVTTDAKNAAMIRSNEIMIGDLKLRKVTAGTAQIMEETKNKMWLGQAIDEQEWMKEMFAFIYIHATPFDEVIEASATPAGFRKAVLLFSNTIDTARLPQAVNAVKQMLEEANVGNDFKTEPEKSGTPTKNS